MEEMLRLNNAFGIGIIKLNAVNVEQSEILIPARYRDKLDWDTVDRLAEINKVFALFVQSVTEDISLKRVKNMLDYDKVLLDEAEYMQYITSKGIAST